MEDIKGVLRNHLRERPFDLYVAFLLFLTGLYSMVSDTWPEQSHSGVVSTLIVIISLYYMAASVIIIASMSCRRKNHPVLALMGEMYGWMFVSFASFATALMYLGSTIYATPASWFAFGVMEVVWIGMCLASGVRFLDLYNVYRGLKR